MKIKKIGHCCLIIEVGGLRVMTDPGMYTTAQEEEKDIDLVVITHEHTDHFHLESLTKVLANNPGVEIITNGRVASLVKEAAITVPITVVEDGQTKNFKDVLIAGFGQKHDPIYRDWHLVDNTGYLFANSFFYPGDALTDPKCPVTVLALPVAGLWLKISEAIDYALALKPKHCFPVHDGTLKSTTFLHKIPSEILTPAGVNFIPAEQGKEMEF